MKLVNLRKVTRNVHFFMLNLFTVSIAESNLILWKLLMINA